MPRLVSVLPWLTAVTVALLSGRAGAQTAVVVWPLAPEAPVPAGDAVTAAGFRNISFKPLAKELIRYQREAEQLRRTTLDATEAALDVVRQAYLEQRFDDMLIALAPLEGDALDVLARPEHRAVLWEVQFQLGLAYFSRNQAGDEELATERFGLALAIHPERRPPSDLYGPDVATAFSRAVTARSKLVARPLRLAATPPDAKVVIDGVPVVDNAQPVNLLPGFHMVYASAPGYRPNAFKVTGSKDGALQIPLDRIKAKSPLDRVGPAWVLGDLRPQTRSGQAAIRAVLGHIGGDVAIVIDAASGTARARAVVITRSEVSETITGKTSRAALKAALARLSPDGRLVATSGVAPSSPAGGEPKSVPIYKRWWFWLAAGVVTGAALIGAREARNNRSQTLQVFVR